MQKNILLVVMLLGVKILAAQNIGIGTNNPNISAQLDVSSTSKGLLIPRLTQAQRNAVATPAIGLMIFQTDNTPGFYYYNGTVWTAINVAGGGGLTLPYTGTASTVGGAEFSITHATTFGDAVYFTNSAGGAAITTAAGNNKFNMSSGNTGIGIPAGLSENPTLGKLVVRGVVGAVSAMFGDQTAGVSVMNNFPSIGFNYYYNAGSKAISTGFGAALGQDPSTGRIYLSSSATSITGAGTAMPLQERLVVLANGNIGLSSATPLATLHVGRGTTVGGTAQFDGTTYSSHFNYNTTEETYIRGGKSTSQVIINDQSTGNIRLAEAGGNVGVGLTNPTNKFSVSDNSANDAARFYNAGNGYAVYALSANGSAIHALSYNSNAPAMNVQGGSSSIVTDGAVGIALQSPTFPLDVNGRIRLRNNGGSNTAGIWLDGNTDTLRSFIGVNNNNTMGFYGGLSGWSFLMDVTDGALMIGTSQKATGYKVNVGGKIIAEEVRVQLRAAWPDYVFEKGYQKMSLDELENYVAVNKHLPNIPSAKEIETNGQQLGEVQRKMLEKIEELSLYIIELKNEIKDLRNK